MLRYVILGLFLCYQAAMADTTVYESTGAAGEASFSDKPPTAAPVEKVIEIPSQSPREQQQGQERYNKVMEQANTATEPEDFAANGGTEQQSPLPPQEDVPQTFDEDDWPDDYGETYIHTGTATGPDRYHYYHPIDETMDDKNTVRQNIETGSRATQPATRVNGSRAGQNAAGRSGGHRGGGGGGN